MLGVSCCTGYRCWLTCVITIVILIILLSIGTILMLLNHHYVYKVLPPSKDSIKIEEQNETCTIINPFSTPNGVIECTFPHTPVTKVSLLETKPGSYFLTSTFCENYPHQLSFDAAESYITGITNDAFHTCLNLSHINLEANEISVLEKDTFSRNYQLEKIDLSQNRLTSVMTTAFFNGISGEQQDSNLTDTLRELDLSENELRVFSTITIAHLKNLEVLNLHGNYALKGFDMKFVLERLKNLKEITFCPKPELKLNLSDKERLIRMYFAVANFKARKVMTDRVNCRTVFG